MPQTIISGQKTHDSVEAALAEKPKSFGELMVATGSRDGREIVRALEMLRTAGRLDRVENGRYVISNE